MLTSFLDGPLLVFLVPVLQLFLRYGAWYLRRSLWRKIDTIEDIRKPSGHDSDEAFERATGQKRLQAVDSVLPPSATDDSQAAAAASDIAHLHSAKEFYKLLRSRGRHIPRWLRACEGTLQQTEIDEATRTAPYGSEVWVAFFHLFL